jgi:hypothetical protein
VSNLQLKPLPPGRCDQPIGLLERGRQRLLHQYRNTELEGTQPHFSVDRSGNSDGHGLRAGKEVVHVHKRRGTQLGRDFCCTAGIRVTHAHEPDLVQLR